MKTTVAIVILVIIAAIVLSASAFTVNEAEQVLVLQFGRPVRVVSEPGLSFRIPVMQELISLEKRLLPWDGAPENMVTRDKKSIFIDVWARWRIVDARKFYESVGGTQGGQKKLDDLIDSAVRDVIAGHNLLEAVRSTNKQMQYETEEFGEIQEERIQDRVEVGRGELENQMLAAVNTSADLEATYGMEVTGIHIKRVDYVDNVRERVYERMKSERMRIASLFESEAEEERNRILGNTRKELDEIEGEMEQKSAEIRGQADAEVITIYAEALSKDPEFFEFLRQLEAYRATLGSGTRLILSTDNEFLRLLRGADQSAPQNP